MSHRDKAKGLLLHYFNAARKPTIAFAGDEVAEIEGIVDEIIDAVLEEIDARRRSARTHT